MKHNLLLFTANGRHTPPTRCSHGNHTDRPLFQHILSSLLVLLMLTMGSGNVWAASVDCSFTQNETIYFRLNNDVNWGDAGAYPAAVFYYSSNSAMDTKTNGSSWDNMSGSCNIGSSNYTTLTSLGSNMWSVTIPRNDIGYIRIVRVSGGDANWTWNNQSKMCITDAGTNNCIYCSGWDNTGTWETYNGGRTNTCVSSEPKTFQGGEVFYMQRNTIAKDENSHDFLKYGRCDFNLYSVDGNTWLNIGLTAEEIPGTDPVMLKFVVPASVAGTVWGQVKVKQLETGGAGHNETNKGAIPTDGKNYLINGKTMEWGTYVPSTPYTGSLYLIGGACTGQDWNLGNATLLENDGNGIYTITRSINAVTGTSTDGFKFLETNANWDSQWRPTEANASTSLDEGQKAQRLTPDVENIAVNRNPGGADTKWQLTESGNYTITIDLSDKENGKMSIKKNAPLVYSLQPWSGDTYKDWYLTGDFTQPGVFDNWTQNPSAYKFTADGDNYQTVSITLDPTDKQIFNNNNLTRFEIIRQGTWDNPRINKPQFDEETSNCSLQTDFKESGSNRMTVKLDKKSIITFKIWRWGTAPGSADRKVTITITPIEQVTVTFNANGSTYATQTIDKDTKATVPEGTPTAADGYVFSGWDWDFNNPVTENKTIDALYDYKPITGVSLNETARTTWVGNSDFTLTANLIPTEGITESVAWSSSDNSIATVTDGTVHAAAEGTATITCTVTDKKGNTVSATCTVTVYPCEMTTDDLYSMTVTGYNTSTGSSATLTGLWNSSELATITVCNVRIGNDGTSWYAYDNSNPDEDNKGTVMIEQNSDNNRNKWQMIATGTANVYYLRNVYTGKYMYCGDINNSDSKGNGWTSNPDWFLRSVYTSKTNGETDSYKFYLAKDDWNNDVIVSRADASNAAKATATDFVLSRQQLTGTPNVWSDVVSYTVSASRGAEQGGNNYKGFQSSFVNIDGTYPNPAYIPSQMNTSYYRMNTDATVQANLGSALVKGAVITVRLYADAATTVTLETTTGTNVETINLTADAARDYTYTVSDASELLGQSAFVIKAADNHACIASITVTRTSVAHPESRDLKWTDTGIAAAVTKALSAGAFSSAATADGAGTIAYTSSDEDIATVATDGQVTLKKAGTTTIKAAIAAEGCYDEAEISYTLTVTNDKSLQDLYDETDSGETLTLSKDYTDDLEVNKPITIAGGGHSIGNLTVEQTGDLTFSSALTVNDFTICAKAGNTSTPAASGQVHDASNLTVNGNAYFLYTVDPGGHVQYGWYDFTVPFPVNAASGIKGIQDGSLNESFTYGIDYAIMNYDGAKQAQGQYPYKKFSGVMQPNQLYSVTLDNDYNYNTLRMQKTDDGNLVAAENVALNTYTGETALQNWNGVGNGTLHHADAGVTATYIQVYQSGDKTFIPVEKSQYSLVVGTAFMVQETGTMTLHQATHSQLLAPRRQATAPATAIQIADEGKPFSDQLFISADETGGQAYTLGVDVAKAGTLGSANVPQIWTTAYNSALCVHRAQLINGTAQYTLSLYAPTDGTYTLTATNIPEDYVLYLTRDDAPICELGEPYTLDLDKGVTTAYGLLLIDRQYAPTAVDAIGIPSSENGKFMRNGILYILHDGKVYNAQGASVR